MPDHRELNVSDFDSALGFMRGSGSSCVVKPANGTSGGAGVTGCVTDAVGLGRARLSAARFDDTLLIERQIPGDMYRLLYLDGKLIDVVRRRSPRVTGDGRSSIMELIIAENRRRLEAERPALPADHRPGQHPLPESRRPVHGLGACRRARRSR